MSDLILSSLMIENFRILKKIEVDPLKQVNLSLSRNSNRLILLIIFTIFSGDLFSYKMEVHFVRRRIPFLLVHLLFLIVQRNRRGEEC